MRKIAMKKTSAPSSHNHVAKERHSFRVTMGLILVMLGVLVVLNMIMMTHNAEEAAASEMHMNSPR